MKTWPQTAALSIPFPTKPAHWGFVGDGMLAGAVSGELFVPPTAKEIIEVTQKLTSKKRVFYIVKNFKKDVDEFCKSRLFLENAGWKVGMAIVKDDISVDVASFEQRRRGVSCTVFSIRSWELMRKMPSWLSFGPN